jgi:hypothetical protein
MTRRLEAAYDPAHIHKVRITCRCERTWVEELPEELHNAQHIAYTFRCYACGQEYKLYRKTLLRIDKESQYDGIERQVNSDQSN